MRHLGRVLGGGILLTAAALTAKVGAAPGLRIQVDLEGDFALVGNTLGHECSNNPTTPVVGTVGACGNGTSDSAPDIFWRSDSPAAGQAEANTSITAANARTTAMLTLPPNAVVRHAYLYWGAMGSSGGGDSAVTLRGPSPADYAVVADDTFALGNNVYQSVADVTAIVEVEEAGPYRLSGVDVTPLVNVDDNNNFGGWWLVVFYEEPGQPLRNLALFDGMDRVDQNNPQNVTLSGFLVPDAGFDGKLGVVAFEGDRQYTGDQFFFDGHVLSGTYNNANNFFNGSRTWLDQLVPTAGDLPQLTGEPGSMAGMDMDVLDVTGFLTAGQTAVVLDATSSQDVYYLAGFVTSISTYKPDFSTSEKSVVDLDGGALLAGDTLEYTIVVTNTGNDTSIETILYDPLPAGVTYVPGSLSISAGANAGAKTDAFSDDQGEYDGAARTVVVRLGTGADEAIGGTLEVDESTTVVFRVAIDANATGSIDNQAIINAAGLLGNPPTDTPTDGNGNGAGSPPTTVDIDECSDNGDCAAPTPLCDTAADPNVCAECLLDVDCPGLLPTCDPATHTCVCVPDGAEVCDGVDNDCNGGVDEGFNVGVACNAGVGACQTAGVVACTGPSTSDCDAVAGQPTPEQCNGIDDDCDGTPDDGNPQGGAGCNSGLPGICAAGTTDCSSGALDCVPNTEPGTETEICGDSLDSDCDGNPSNGCPGTDTDGDGLLDDDEIAIGTDPNDADSDDDGVPDGQEPNVSVDSDGDGLINGLDPDSDNDGLLDGTEMGLDCSGSDTDMTAGNCVPDADGGATTTNPLDADTDHGGVSDGSEDPNRDGAIDAGETDPNDPSDDASVPDSDGDGLSDPFELAIGTDPFDADSDNDGVPDGAEPNPAADTDGDGLINALDPDSDNDGLFDGTEMGFDCSNPDTDPAAGTCVPDGDAGATTTSPVNPDTDGGGVPDGEEDADHDGVIDPGETDPNDPADDSGGTGGAGGTGGSGAGASSAAPPDASGLYAEGAGLCQCSVPGTGGDGALPVGLGLVGLGLLAARRERRRTR